MTVALHYTVDGPVEAPALILGASLGTTTDLWRRQVPELARRLHVVRYDHRGHGGSPSPDGPYRIADLAGDVLALMDRLGIARAHLAGLSLGGMVAMWIAAREPARVDRLALVCTSAHVAPARMWAERAGAVRSAGMAAIADAVVSRWVPQEYAARHPEVLAELRAMLLSASPSGYAACCDALEVMDLRPDLHLITAETLVIAGLQDNATPPSHAQQIVAGISRAHLTLVAGAAHLANVSRPELVGRALTEFLSAGAQPPRAPTAVGESHE